MLLRRFNMFLALGLILAATSIAGAQTENRLAPRSAAEVQMSFAPLVKQTAPAVVNIYAKKRVVQQAALPRLFDDPFFRRFFGPLPEGLTQERVENSLGSGVILRADGWVVTNHHVVNGASEIVVALHDRREFPAELVVDDERTDLAVLKLKNAPKNLPVLQFKDSDEIQVGDLVMAIGDPFGVGQTVTTGIVSGLARTQVTDSAFSFFIQTDAAINPGNSGGALVTMDGKLAGINTAIFSKSGGSHGIGFAIPANMVASVVNQALQGGKVVRPWLGAQGQQVTSDLAKSLGLDRPGGVLINSVSRNSPAEEGGLKIGDVVLAVNGKPTLEPQALNFRIATRPLGETMTLLVIREGEEVDIEVEAVAAPETPRRQLTDVNGNNPFNGSTVANLSPAFAEEIGTTDESGVIIFKMQRNSVAARVGFRPGDIVLSVQGQATPDVDTLKDVLSDENGARQWLVEFNRNGRVQKVNIRG